MVSSSVNSIPLEASDRSGNNSSNWMNRTYRLKHVRLSEFSKHKQEVENKTWLVVSQIIDGFSFILLISACVFEVIDYTKEDSNNNKYDIISLVANCVAGILNLTSERIWNRLAFGGNPPETSHSRKNLERCSNFLIAPAVAGAVIDLIPSASVQVSQAATLITICSDGLSLITGVVSKILDYLAVKKETPESENSSSVQNP